ncbi:MAG TPA: DUF3817 domain-containing protein [Daejeonella sp.]|nr:DUF3817 domain-containing protein [Daejeonella sp.]
MPADLLKTPLGRFRMIAFAEGCSYLLLGFTMILKYSFLMPQPNYIVGMVHGLLFITYTLLLVQVALQLKWPFQKILLVFSASLIPFGTFYADKKYLRK